MGNIIIFNFIICFNFLKLGGVSELYQAHKFLFFKNLLIIENKSSKQGYQNQNDYEIWRY